MEFLVGFVVIVIILLILGVGFDVIMFGVLGLMLLSVAATAIFFLYLIARILFSRSADGVFTHIGRAEKRRYDSAFYNTGFGELPNIFPAEVIMKDKFYSAEKTVKVLVDRRKKYVYDKNAILTIFIGEALCILTLLFFYLILSAVL